MSRTINLSWTELRTREATAAKLYAATKPADLTPSVTYTNATTTGLYSGNSMGSTRAGADDHLAHVSRGMGKQIVRV